MALWMVGRILHSKLIDREHPMQAHAATPITGWDTSINPQLVELTTRLAGESGQNITDIPGLTLYRADDTGTCHRIVCEPSLCFFIQGRKQVSFGDHDIEFPALTYMVNNIHLPIRAGVLDASPDQPYLAVKVAIDPSEVADLILQFGDRLPASEKDSECSLSSCGLCRASMDDAMQQALQRLLELLEKPDDIAVLAPMARREILYRAMMGELGPRIRKFATHDTQANRISRVIATLQERYTEPLRVSELAEQAIMSESALFHTFKRVTRMSPLQFQKKLRLHEARRLMLAEGMEAAAASYRVGYESPSQFSREYSRLFGAPPKTDVSKLRGLAETVPA